MTGRILANRYRIGERIGGGGMALVYRAEDMQLGREVAVKVLRGHFGSDEDFVRRFRREAQNAASLSHPNVVQIYDIGQEDDLHYIVMELVEGKTLKTLIQEQGPLPVIQAAEIAIQILSALAHAHAQRIVHRDIKPHNILISKSGQVKVTDFGIARATTSDTVTHTGSILGSAHYFSPEQADGQPTGECSDIYSVGVVLYEMVTGTVPFQGESPITVALKHIREKPLPPSQLNPEVPVELEEIILRALEKAPADRYPSAAAMKEALEQFIRDHEAGRTHLRDGDFPTMDLRTMRTHKAQGATAEWSDPAAIEQTGSKKGDWRKRLPRIAGVALLVVLLAVGLVWGAVRFLAVPVVEVPDVTGMYLKDAQEALAAAGLQWTLGSEEFSDEVPQTHVIRTDPEPGSLVKKGRKIRLDISRGPETKQVPDVRNLTVEEARALLESERFKVEITEKAHTAKAGLVVDQLPAPLTNLKAGSTIHLVVSSGPLLVPQVAGKTVDQVRQTLTAAGLVPGDVTYVEDITYPEGIVITTDPAPDTAVEPGQKVNLIVSKGAPKPTPFEKVITIPGEPGESFPVRISLVEVINGVPIEQPPVLDEERKAGEKLTIRGSFRGQGYLRVIINGIETRVELP
ncbi:MAG TPA: Stk1 family PASTA domain-containing Ser/Thr kinase [Symbiobacteriaceae bacterium]